MALLNKQLDHLMNAMKHWIHTIAYCGADKVEDPDVSYSIFMANVNGSIFLIVDTLLGLVFYAVTRRIELLWLMLSSGISFFTLSVGLNLFGFYNLSRLSTGFIGSLLVTACALLVGKDSNTLSSFILGAIFPLIYFKSREIIPISIALLIPFVNLVIILFYDFTPLLECSEDEKTILSLIFLTVPYAGIVINTFILKRINERQKNRLLESEQEVTNLLRVLCHDVINPASVVSMVLNALISGRYRTEEDQKKSLATIKRASDAIISILSTVRENQSVKDKKVKLNIENFDLKEALENVIAIFEAPAQEKQIQIKFANMTSRALISLETDKSIFMHQVFGNILSNAIKFTPKNKSIYVYLYEWAPERVSIVVKDEGVGIPTDVLKKLFRLQGPSSSRPGTNGERGTGYGLPLAKAYVELMGGLLKITSQEMKSTGDSSGDHGTTVSIELAIAEKNEVLPAVA